MKDPEKILNTIIAEKTGITRKEISKKTGMTENKLYPYLKELLDKGQCQMRKENVDNRLMNVYYPLGGLYDPEISRSSVRDVDEKLVKQKPYNEKADSPGYEDVEVETVPNHPFNSEVWGELKNRLILNGECGEALKIMVAMENEKTPITEAPG